MTGPPGDPTRIVQSAGHSANCDLIFAEGELGPASRRVYPAGIRVKREIGLGIKYDGGKTMTIYKIGGSLLDLPGLGDVINGLLAQRPRSPTMLVAGGGAAAEAVRVWDKAHDLGDETAHDLALAAMDLTSLLLAKLVPESRPVRSVQQVRMAANDGVVGLLCADCFVKSAEAQGHPPFERSWRVTSDSIAAWAASVVRAAELVLVKSVPLPAGISLADASRTGIVDEAFPELAQGLPAIGWVNARSLPIVTESWIAR